VARDWTQDEVIKDLERVIEKQDKEIERLRGVLQEIADAKISGVIDDGYNVRDWLIKHHVILVNKARAALGEDKLWKTGH